MSAEKTEALRLAEQLEAIGLHGPVAAELRRLYAEVERLSLDSVHTCHAECQRPLCKLTRERDEARRTVREAHEAGTRLTAQRDALLKALKGMLLHMGMDEDEWNKPTFDHARAAIAKAEEA